MAKEYAYYLEGNKIALVERDTNFDNNVDSKEFGPGVSRQTWKSPQSTITDGLEIKYAHSPNYFIESTDTTTTTISGWDQDNDGNFRLRASGATDWTSSPNLSAVEWFVLKNAGKFNGLHKVSSVTNNRIVTTTKVSASTSETAFEETVTLYYDVNVLNDEADNIDIPSYLQKALVYYVKARIAEDAANFEVKEYMQKEFRKLIEKFENTRISGPRIISSGSHAIR